MGNTLSVAPVDDVSTYLKVEGDYYYVHGFCPTHDESEEARHPA